MIKIEKGRINIIYIICLILLLWMPILIYPVVNSCLDHTNYENRALVTWEEVINSEWYNFFPNVEQFIQDNIVYKNECVKAVNWVDEKLFDDPFNNKVMVGKDNWLFYKGEGCIQDYRGGYVLSEAELKSYADAAERLNKVLNDQGVELCLLITPNKEAIYGERYLPDKVKKVSGESRADQIVGYLKQNTDCNIVYLKDALLGASADCQIWKKYDTHWNEIGAFVAAQEFLDKEGIPAISLTDVAIKENGNCSGDLANMLGKGASLNDDHSYEIHGYREDIECEVVETMQQPNLNYSKIISNDDSGKTALFIGDSFLGSIEEYVSKNYRTSLFIHRDNYSLMDRDLFTTEKPDVVVIESAERFLDSYADWCNVYASRFTE